MTAKVFRYRRFHCLCSLKIVAVMTCLLQAMDFSCLPYSVNVSGWSRSAGRGGTAPYGAGLP